MRPAARPAVPQFPIGQAPHQTDHDAFGRHGRLIRDRSRGQGCGPPGNQRHLPRPRCRSYPSRPPHPGAGLPLPASHRAAAWDVHLRRRRVVPLPDPGSAQRQGGQRAAHAPHLRVGRSSCIVSPPGRPRPDDGYASETVELNRDLSIDVRQRAPLAIVLPGLPQADWSPDVVRDRLSADLHFFTRASTSFPTSACRSCGSVCGATDRARRVGRCGPGLDIRRCARGLPV